LIERGEIAIFRDGLPDSLSLSWVDLEKIIPARERTGVGPEIGLRLTSGPDTIGMVLLGFYPRDREKLDELDSADYQYLHELSRLLTLRVMWMQRQADEAEIMRLRGALGDVAKLLGNQ